jgi:hypothetical protein
MCQRQTNCHLLLLLLTSFLNIEVLWVQVLKPYIKYNSTGKIPSVPKQLSIANEQYPDCNQYVNTSTGKDKTQIFYLFYLIQAIYGRELCCSAYQYPSDSWVQSSRTHGRV